VTRPLDQPQRIQRQRVRGWCMPPSTIYVGRPSRWGNPWTIEGARRAGFTGSDAYLAAFAAGMFRRRMLAAVPVCEPIVAALPELRGRDLACWCRLDWPCHADTLLLLANRPLQCEGMDA
jgi:hypothetical protein